ncbi:MAG TPA: hypothetical protein PKW55_05200 [Spirochaetota bacterium]|nr:hypothetical protein [Spirochaetota bacterium]HOM37652.1 hypothetical protein [Spirochaetota bacterium]HPQ49610.1 hypothetical protein [Spirochaetota bacterium]
MLKNRKCYYCNGELEIIKEGYTITDFCTTTSNKKCYESVETVKTYLCRCNLCKKDEIIKEEEPTFISLDDVYKAIKEDKIFSNNPEISVLVKIIQRLIV